MDVFKIHNLGFTCFCISISYGKYRETFIFYGAQSRVITQINVLHSYKAVNVLGLCCGTLTLPQLP